MMSPFKFKYATLLSFLLSTHALANVAFYYGEHPPQDKLRWFDTVVVSPDSLFNPRDFNTQQSKALAYLSVGEAPIAVSRTLPKEAVIGKNTIWASEVMDISNPAWQKYLLDQVANRTRQGYQGFFLDTLDSYQLAAKTDADKQKQVAALISLIQKIKQQSPQAQIILNRGFELVPQVKNLINGVAAESLFASWDQKNKRYVPVPANERMALLKELYTVKAQHIPVISIEYVPDGQTQLANNVIKQVNQMGFTPWVTNGELTNLDFMLPSGMPRKIIVICDGIIPHYAFDYDALNFLSMPIQYLGYIPILWDIDKPLPNLSNREFAGVGVWLSREHPERADSLYRWLINNKNKNIPIAFFGRFGFGTDNTKLQPFGLNIKTSIRNTHWIKTEYQSPMMGFETQTYPKPEDFIPITTRNGKPLVTLVDAIGNKGNMAAITPWGGYTLYPYLVEAVTKDEPRWVLNPFQFLQQALHLPLMPIPDTTTENGRRIMFAHIDGDGIANKGEWLNGPYSGKVILDDILMKYRIPTSVSIIQGEVAPNGVFPQYSKDLEAISREMFKLPWVEIASHTFSHPYNWQPKAIDPEIPASNKFEAFNLNIPHYRYNLKDEIAGSVNYINTTLAPKGKTCKALFWSGDANPSAEALRQTYALNLRNLNGGDSDISNYNNSITQVGPLGLFQNTFFQNFAPLQNDYTYTNEWTAPFYGFINVIDAFKLTENPTRLKPIDIYYHMYAGSKLSALDALKKIYDWCLTQPIINVYATDYVDKVSDFNSIAISRQGQGWIIRNSGKLREFRVPKTAGFPDLLSSQNVVGYNSHGTDHYIHLGANTQTYLQLTQNAPTVPYLVDANAMIKQFERKNNELHLQLTGYLPLKLTLGNMNNCWTESDNKTLTPKTQQNGQMTYELAGVTEHAFTIKCK